MSWKKIPGGFKNMDTGSVTRFAVEDQAVPQNLRKFIGSQGALSPVNKRLTRIALGFLNSGLGTYLRESAIELLMENGLGRGDAVKAIELASNGQIPGIGEGIWEVLKGAEKRIRALGAPERSRLFRFTQRSAFNNRVKEGIRILRIRGRFQEPIEPYDELVGVGQKPEDFEILKTLPTKLRTWIIAFQNGLDEQINDVLKACPDQSEACLKEAFRMRWPAFAESKLRDPRVVDLMELNAELMQIDAPEEIIVYRGLGEEAGQLLEKRVRKDLENLDSQEVLRIEGLVSSTADYLDAYDSGQSYILEMVPRTGLIVGGEPDQPWDIEFLQASGVAYKPVAIVEGGEGVTVIQVVEV